MIEYIVIGISLFLFWVWIRSGIKIDVQSFFMPTKALATGVFGVYCFTGKQGSGKTYSLNKFVRKFVHDRKIYSNVTLKGIDYTRIESIDHLLSLRDEKQIYIIFDEIFTLMQKTTKFNDDIMEFLTQQRKQENIFLTTAQEWLELPMTFRRFVRIQIECHTRPLGRFGGILIESYYDAYNMKWSQLDNEYVAPLLQKKISKYEKRFMESYDTFERIHILKKTNLPQRVLAPQATRGAEMRVATRHLM